MADEKSLDVKVSIPQQMRDVDILQLRREPVKVPAIPSNASTISAIQTCIEQIKKVIETREGTNGSWVEKSVTWRDLIGSGLARVSVNGDVYNPGGGGGGGGGGGILPPLNPPDTPIYLPPPAPTNVQASGAMTNIIVEWDQPGYSYHGYAEIWRAESNVLGNAVLIGTSTSTVYVDNVGTDVNRYYWIRFMSKWDVLGPYNDTDGTLATTGLDIPYILDQLTGQITQTQLDATLSAEIDQIDVLAIEVSSLSAGVSGAFDPFTTYYFDTSAEGWVADTAATVTHSSGHLIVNSTGSTPSVKLNVDLSPGVTGANYPVVKARVKRVSGSTWSGTLQWKTSGHGFSASYQKVLSNPTIAIGDYATLEWDMSADADYTGANPILNLRIELGAASDDDFDIDWIAVGRNAPGASVAMVGAETTARVAADSAEVTQRELLAVKLIGTADPDDIDNLADLAAGLIFEEKSVRVSEDEAIAQDIQTLSTTVDGNTTAIQINAQSINGLEAQYSVKIDSNGYVSGFGLSSENPTGEPGGQISTFGVRADTFYIASPTGPGITPTMPFIVKTTSWVSAGGITNPPGVYMQDAYIADGQIVNAKIGNLAVDDAKIANLSAGKITTGEIAADRLNANTITSKVLSVDMAKLVTGIVGGNIYSVSYAAGSAGWALYQNGYADLNNVQVRGQINGGAYTGYAWPTAGNYGFHLGPNGLLLGNANNNKYVQITSDGQFYAPGLTILNGSATFSGVLSAAGGSFAGAIIGTAVVGNAQIGDAQVSTLKISGNAVTVPSTYLWDGDYRGGNGVPLTFTVYVNLDQPGMVFASYSGIQAQYGNSADWQIVLYINGSVVANSGAIPFGAWQSVYSLSGALQCGAGSIPVTMYWYGASPFIGVRQMSIYAVGAKR